MPKVILFKWPDPGAQLQKSWEHEDQLGHLGHTCARAEVGIKAEGEVALSGGERAMGLMPGRKGWKQLEEELKEAAIYIYFWPCGILVP